jgi:hypothetical protein
LFGFHHRGQTADSTLPIAKMADPQTKVAVGHFA